MTLDFKNWLIAQMELRGWTQESLGKLVGVSQVTIGKWIKGDNRPEPQHLRKIAELTNANPIDLFILVGYLHEEDRVARDERANYHVTSRQRAVEIFREIEHWPDEMLDLLNDQIKFVLKPRLKK